MRHCKDPYTVKVFKQLLEKVVESSEFMCQERLSCRLFVRDVKAMGFWEADVRKKSTPLMTFYEKWRLTHQKNKPRVHNRLDTIFAGMPPPIEQTMAVMREGKEVFYKEPLLDHLNILPSDSEDEKDYFQNKGIEKASPKEKIKKKKGNTKPKKKVEVEIPDAADAGDIVQEFKARDW